MYENRNIIAQGDQQSMMDLKQSIEDLVRSNDVIDFVNKYHELYNESRGNNEDLRRLKDEIRNLLDSVHGDKTLNVTIIQKLFRGIRLENWCSSSTFSI
jgi:hypothetical protein